VEKRFVLKSGDALSGARAPDSGGKAISIVAKVEQPGDGVIVAQGGAAHGFSLYVKDGVLTFGVRITNELHVVAATEKLAAAGASEVGVKLARDGTVAITVNGKAAGGGEMPGVLARTPVDGLSVGSDTKAAVGDYEAPFEFKGKVGEVVVSLE
jgi:arylsulfatase